MLKFEKSKLLCLTKIRVIKYDFSSKSEKFIDITTKIDKTNFQINIPKTNFNERLNSDESETSYVTKITQEFYNDQLKRTNNKLWYTHDGPTFANGLPPLGLL